MRHTNHDAKGFVRKEGESFDLIVIQMMREVVLCMFELLRILLNLWVAKRSSCWIKIRRVGFHSSINLIYYWCGCLSYADKDFDFWIRSKDTLSPNTTIWAVASCL